MGAIVVLACKEREHTLESTRLLLYLQVAEQLSEWNDISPVFTRAIQEFVRPASGVR
jgi:hypothetical protein